MLRLLFKKIAKLIEDIFVSANGLRQQNYKVGLDYCGAALMQIEEILNILINNKSEYIKYGVEVEEAYFLELLQSLEDAQRKKDYVLVADICEGMIIPYLTQVQQLIMSVCDNIDDLLREDYSIDSDEKYVIEPTSQGYATLAVVNGDNEKVYMHSNCYPSLSAIQLAHKWYSEEKYVYVVYGMGLGYEILELIRISAAIKVIVYESHNRIYKYAKAYGVLDRLEKSGQVEIIIDENFKELQRYDFSDVYTKFIINNPSVRCY